jgi:hypothetical protein
MTTLSSRFELAVAELRKAGISLTIQPGTYAVNFIAVSTPATAYFSEDLDDAIEHGREMAASALPGFIKRSSSAEGAKPRRLRRPLKMTPKAIRRRMIRAHNRRMRARAIKSRGETF